MKMEYLVDMVTTVPDRTTDAEVDAIKTREAARARDLAAQGHLLRLWRPPPEAGEWLFQGLHPYTVGPAGVAEYYADQPMGMTAAYTLRETRTLSDGLVLGYGAVALR